MVSFFLNDGKEMYIHCNECQKGPLSCYNQQWIYSPGTYRDKRICLAIGGCKKGMPDSKLQEEIDLLNKNILLCKKG